MVFKRSPVRTGVHILLSSTTFGFRARAAARKVGKKETPDGDLLKEKEGYAQDCIPHGT